MIERLRDTSDPSGGSLPAPTEVADLLDAMLADLAALTKCLSMAEGGQVVFKVGTRHDSAQVVVDGTVRFHIAKARHIEFDYGLAGVRSDDWSSYTVPPMRWGERLGEDDDDAC